MIGKNSSVQVLLVDWSQIWAREQWDGGREDWYSLLVWFSFPLACGFMKRKGGNNLERSWKSHFQASKKISLVSIELCQWRQVWGPVEISKELVVLLLWVSTDPSRRHMINMDISRLLLLLQFPWWEGIFFSDCVCKQNSRGPGWICLVLSGPLHWSASPLSESTCSASESSRFFWFI